MSRKIASEIYSDENWFDHNANMVLAFFIFTIAQNRNQNIHDFIFFYNLALNSKINLVLFHILFYDSFAIHTHNFQIHCTV